jgi:dihydrofolate reductase
MKTILIFVSSLDGKITKWGDPYIRSWSSKSDQDYFDAVWADTRVIIMGSGTYIPDPVKPSSKHLFIIITRQPEKYAGREIPGKIEFTSASPSQLVKRFENEREEKVLVVGGPRIATAFFNAELIDELWLTIEPRIFGRGSGFVINDELDINLILLSCEKANEQGTLLTKYQVVRNNIFSSGNNN